MATFVSGVATRSIASLPGPRPWPLLGAAHDLGATTAHLDFERWSRTYGEVFRFRLGPKESIGVATPELVRDLLQARPDSFRRLGILEPIANELGIDGVFSAEGARWRRQRRLMNPSFHAPRIESFHGSIETVVTRLFDRWSRDARAGTSVDVLADLMRFTVDVTSIVVFGRDLNTVEKGTETVQKHLEVIFPVLNRRLLAPVAYWRAFPFLDRGLEGALAGMRTFISELVVDARTSLTTSPGRREKPTTFVESMVLARDDEESEQPFTDEEVHGNVLTLLLAGEDTTAITIAWMLYYFACRPQVAARARAEVDAVVTGAVPTVAEARELRYVEAVALEALRLHPPGPQIMLEATHDVVVAGVEVPKGTGVMLMLRLIQLNPNVFGDPTSFRPERFLDDAPADTKPHTPRLMLAFGAGPRVCPGRGLALLECALLVGALVKRFDLELACAEGDVSEITAFTVQPRGIAIRFRER